MFIDLPRQKMGCYVHNSDILTILPYLDSISHREVWTKAQQILVLQWVFGWHNHFYGVSESD